MTIIHLPISKSIANRALMLQAIHRDPLMRVSVNMPDDVIVLHDALEKLSSFSHQNSEFSEKHPLVLHLKNCGTALRFLQVHLEKCYPGAAITLTGDPRLLERVGKPTTQTASARILHGENVPSMPDESPYITMSRSMAEAYPNIRLEYDWSSAAFWYEYMALQPLLYPNAPSELLLNGLTADSLQGDHVLADIYSKHFGVMTTFTADGAIIVNTTNRQSVANYQSLNCQLELDFTDCPDLYPAVALTCERLGLILRATGTERLAYKESNRLQAVATHQTRHDHRMAMALHVASYPVDDTACIAKSYPSFLSQWANVINRNK